MGVGKVGARRQGGRAGPGAGIEDAANGADSSGHLAEHNMGGSVGGGHAGDQIGGGALGGGQPRGAALAVGAGKSAGGALERREAQGVGLLLDLLPHGHGQLHTFMVAPGGAGTFFARAVSISMEVDPQCQHPDVISTDSRQ